MHSVVAKVAYTEQLKDCDVADIKKKYPDLRQKAKEIEFSINYGGDYNTIAGNMGISKKEAKKIYFGIMDGLPGLKKYQEYCRKIVMEKGYILLCPQTGHKAYIYDYPELLNMKKKLEDKEFMSYYWEMSKSSPECDTVSEVRKYNKRVRDSEKQCIDYKIQGRGSMCFKLFSTILFNYLLKNDLLFKVLYCIPVHDEANLDCPKDISDKIAKVLEKCMEKGASPFMKTLTLTAEAGIYNHWVH